MGLAKCAERDLGSFKTVLFDESLGRVAGLVLGLLGSACCVLTEGLPASPLIHVTTRLHEISVVVHDHEGQPVPNLSNDDFIVSDNGTQQSLSTFEVSSVAHRAEGGISAQPPGDHAGSTNRPSLPDGSQATVLLLDLFNTRLTNQAFAKQQVIQFVQKVDWRMVP